LAEAGLAISTTVAAMVQLLLLAVVFSRREAPLGWRRLAATTARTILATLVMGVVVHLTLARMPEGGRLASQLVRVGVPLLFGMATYCGAYLLLGGRELGMLLSGKTDP
jgi:peptidoglycan biosynthesis protein MviN/MurJ (putative lipid II flippase)